MVQQSVTLNPGESKLISFEAVPAEAKTYQVSVDGLAGSFRAVAAGPLPPAGEASIWGYVTESLTGVAVPDVSITLDGLVRKTYWAGQYEIRDIAAQKYRITFSKEGYESVSRDVIATVEGTELNISLPPIIPAKPTLVYAYPAEAQMASGGTGYINYKVGIPDITTGNWLFFLFGLEGIYWWQPYACASVNFKEGRLAGYYEGSATIYIRYLSGTTFKNVPPGTYRLLSSCLLYRKDSEGNWNVVKTYWSKVDTGEKITVV